MEAIKKKLIPCKFFSNFKPKFILAVMLDEPKNSKDYIYNYMEMDQISNIKVHHLTLLDGHQLK